MNIYYTAKDIEEMAAKGIQQVEIGPGITLTDYARETARQFNMTLVDGKKPVSSLTPSKNPSRSSVKSDKYNKPSGCQHASNSLPSTNSQSAISSIQSIDTADSNTVNSLIDLMGKVIKRGE